MVIISVGICNKNGQLIVSRQFENIRRSNVQDMYLSFPKLISSHQQHTYVQSDQYTFLYIPLDGLFLVLISTKNSNIIQDQQTLRMIYKVITAICVWGIDLENIQKYAIDIILGIDDVVSMGYRQSVSIQQVCEQLKMQSSDQKAYLALVKQQQQDAKQASKKMAQKLSKK